MPDLHQLTATQAAALIASREISAVELMRACLRHAEKRDGQVGAWAYLDHDQALAQAAAADASEVRSPLHGVPFGVKDVIDTADLPTELGSAAHAGRRPARDALCVGRMREAGAVLMGKLVTTEYALFSPNRTRHPLDRARTPGGSSSGTAAAVADCHVPIGFGTQTAGSLIRPAAFCGVFGMKPTHAVVPLDGILPLAPFLDTIGLMARSVADLQAFFTIVSRGGLSKRRIGRQPRIALCRTHQWDRAQPETRLVLEGVARQLDDHGCVVEEFSLPPGYGDLVPVHRALLCRGIAETLERYYRAGPISDSLAAMIEEGLALSPESYAEKLRVAESSRFAIDAEFRDYDALLCPSTPGEAPLGWATGDPVFQVTWTLLGVPCVNLPLGRGPNDLPVGVQIVGRRHDDLALLEIAGLIWERVAPIDLSEQTRGARQEQGVR